MLRTFEEMNALLSPHGPIQSIMTDEERQYIWDLIRSIPSCTAIEIGSGYGGTTLLMVQAGAEVWSVDNWACDQKDVFLENIAAVSDRVHLIEGNSVLCAGQFSDDSYDLVLVDGDHGEANGGDDSVPGQDISLYAPKVRLGGYLLIDDVDNGHPAVTSAVEEFRKSPDFVLDQYFTPKLMGFRRCR